MVTNHNKEPLSQSPPALWRGQLQVLCTVLDLAESRNAAYGYLAPVPALLQDGSWRQSLSLHGGVGHPSCSGFSYSAKARPSLFMPCGCRF